jgi:ComF family protein
MTWAPGKQLFRVAYRQAGMVLNLVLSVLWPARCAACNTFVAEGTVFCQTCSATLDPIADACPRCAMPLAGENCPGCGRHPFPFARALAAVAYGGAVTSALIRWKHGGNRHIGPVLATTFAPLVRRAIDEGVEVACPVPLHPHRLRQRGFNQALDLLRGARGLTLGTRQLAIVCDALDRTVDTPSLGHASPSLRRTMVAGAFRVTRPAAVTGKHVLLADDVMTSGATFAECTRVLLAAGARRVTVAALARAV